MEKTITIVITILIFATISISNEKAENIESIDLPSYFSWQNINGTSYVTPIKDQSPAPTCEAYALCASLETLIKLKIGEYYNPDLSETHLYFYAGGT